MRRVLIGTPSYDGRIDVWFANSLLATVKKAIEKGIFVHAIYTSYDSLIQRARNSLFKLAIEGGYDDLFFIDSDAEWEPDWFFNLLERPEPFVGGALVKKSEKSEGYTVKLIDKDLKWSEDKKIIQVDGVGTGFLKIGRFALEKLWKMSDKYMSEGEEHRMVCDIKVENGDLISEDYILCNKWKSLGYKVWLDPTITLNHIGTKKYKGDFQAFIKKHGYV
jgi:glycosyltransferase involved in cell wall biosynthesis